MPPEYVFRGRSAAMREPSDHAQVLTSGEVLVDRGVLTGEPDDAPDLVGLLHDVVPQDGGRPRVGLEDGGEDPHRRRLAGAVRAQQAQHGAGLDLERHAVEGAHVAPGKDLHEVLCLHGDRRVVRISHRQRNLVLK